MQEYIILIDFLQGRLFRSIDLQKKILGRDDPNGKNVVNQAFMSFA